MFTAKNFEQVSPGVVRFWAGVDAVVAPMLAFPPLAKLFVQVLYWLNGLAGGEATAPEFAPIHWFFVCLSGALVAIWALVRLLRPLGLFALIDGIGRAWVGGLLLYFILFEGLPVVLLFFVFSELAGSVFQLAAMNRRR